MASSQYSILRQYTPYISPYNIDLIKDVMMYKQGKVDNNRAAMNQQMDYLMGQEIDKPEARAYMEDKMSNVIHRVNERYRGADLSSDGITRAIQSEISSVLDTTVINAIAGTREGRKMKKYIEELKQNHPEQYSAVNEWDTMKHYYSWIQDGNAGSRLNPLQYTPYVNYTKEMNDFILKYKKENKGKKIQTEEYDSSGNPTGRIIEYDVDELTRTQVINLGISNMSSNMQQQMRIEADYMAETNPLFSNKQAVGNYLSGYASTYDRQLGALRAELATVGDNKYAKNKILNNMEMIKNEKAQALEQIGSILQSGDPRQAANFIVRQNFFDGLANTWSYDNTSITRKKDETYFARLKEDRDQRRFMLDVNKASVEISKIEAEIEKTKLETERLKKTPIKDPNSNSSGSSGNSGGNGLPAFTVSNELAPTNTTNLVNLPFNRMDAASQVKTSSLRSFWNSFNEDDRADIIAAVQSDQNKNPELYEGKDDYERFYTYFKNNKGYRNEYLMSEEGRAAREAFTKITESDREITESIKAVNSVSGLKANYLASPEAVLKSRERLGAINPDLNNRSDKDIQAMNLVAGMIYGQKAVDAGSTGTLSDQAKEALPRMSASRLLGYGSPLSAALSGVIASGYITKNVLAGLFSKPGATNVMASINAIKKLYGDDFDLSTYLTINKDGEVELKPASGNEPNTIRILRESLSKPDMVSTIANGLEEEIKESASPKVISELLARDHYIDSFRTFSFSKSSPAKSEQKLKYDALSAIVDTAGKGYKLDKISTLSLVSAPKEDGGVNWFIRVGGEEDSDLIPVSESILKQNNFDVSAPERRIPLTDYKSDIEDCSFVDTSRKPGRDYDKRLVHNLGLQGVASKNDVKTYIKSDINSYGAFLNDQDKRYMERVGEALIGLSDHVAIRIEGYNNDSQKGLYVRLFDKETVNSSKPIEIASDDIPISEDYADYYNMVFEYAPQYFFSGVIRKAITTRLNSLAPYYNPNGVNNITVEGDLMDSLSDFWIKKNKIKEDGSRQQ